MSEDRFFNDRAAFLVEMRAGYQVTNPKNMKFDLGDCGVGAMPPQPVVRWWQFSTRFKAWRKKRKLRKLTWV